MKINIRLYILFFLSAVTVEEISSSGLECHRGVKFFDEISLSWMKCSVCSEPGGSQFKWQCNQCCPETTTSRPPTTGSPITSSESYTTSSPSTESATHILVRRPKLSIESSVSNTSLKHHKLALRTSTGLGKPWTKTDTVITVLGVTLALTVASVIAFVTWKVLTKKSRNMHGAQAVAERDDGTPREGLNKLSTECTETNNPPFLPTLPTDDGDEMSRGLEMVGEVQS